MAKKAKETLEAKLRNQLTPVVGLAEMVLIMDKDEKNKPALMKLVVKTAKQVLKNNLKIIKLLQDIENQKKVTFESHGGIHVDGKK